jgi:formylmethanofuran dehydrogenase subunit B
MVATGSKTAEAIAARASGRATCPFCALLCDDLAITTGPDGTLTAANVTCPRAREGFGRAVGATSPQIGGRDATPGEALDAAAALLKASRLPLFGGCATDVDGMRALLALADAAGGVIDHARSAGAFRNLSVLQSRGWVNSTLTEVRNRADLVIVVGEGIGDGFPRFYERILAPAETLFGNLSRSVVLVGSGADRALVAKGMPVDVLACDTGHLAAFVAALRSALKGTVPAAADEFDGPAIAALAARIKAAAYPVFVWSAGALPESGGDLVVLSLSDLIRDLNVTQRAAGLPLSGSEGGQTAISVTAWQTGYPLRVSLATGKPMYDPERFDIARMIASGEGDCLLWTASFSPELAPPPTTLPTILVATPGVRLARPPAVFIPVGTPGIDHHGDLIRCDSVVTLPLRAHRDRGLPSVAAVASAIADRLAI